MNATHASLGRGSACGLSVSIGPVALDLALENEKLAAAAKKRYAAFFGKECGALPIQVSSQNGAAGTDAEFQSSFEQARVEATGKGARFEGVSNEYVLDSLLRMFLSWELLARDGFLLHAATVLRNGRAYIFTGKSGAGKSTVASLSPKGSVLTDEISLLQRKNGRWFAHGTPFWGEFRAVGSNAEAPVAGIFSLTKSRENRATPVRAAKLAQMLLPNILFFSPKVEDQRRLLEIAGAASEEIPGYALEFRKDRTFWEVLP